MGSNPAIISSSVAGDPDDPVSTTHDRPTRARPGGKVNTGEKIAEFHPGIAHPVRAEGVTLLRVPQR